MFFLNLASKFNPEVNYFSDFYNTGPHNSNLLKIFYYARSFLTQISFIQICMGNRFFNSNYLHSKLIFLLKFQFSCNQIKQPILSCFHGEIAFVFIKMVLSKNQVTSRPSNALQRNCSMMSKLVQSWLPDQVVIALRNVILTGNIGRLYPSYLR